jgi:hypothetical protein
MPDALVWCIAQLAKKIHASHSWEPDASTRDPRRVLFKVAQGSTLWCLVEYASDNDMDEKKDYGWHRFHSEADIKAYAGRATGEPLSLPSLSMTPYQVEQVVRFIQYEAVASFPRGKIH